MKYAFTLGRNPELSYAEIISFLQSRNISFEKFYMERNVLILEFSQDPELNIQEFGGVLKIGKIDFEGTEKEFSKFLKKEDLFDSDKFSYSVISNFELESLLSEKFKKERRKAFIKRGRKKLKLQDKTEILIPNADIEFLGLAFKDKIIFGELDQDYSYAEIKKRDMAKPIRRESLAISPRLSKIMINLSRAKQGDLLLDGFCGVGGILQEALIKKINVYGVDKDKQAIESARKNLKWLEKNYDLGANWRLQAGDSRNIKNISPDAITSEPALGDVVRKKPSNNKAEEYLRKFESLIIPILKNFKKIKKENAKIVLTIPFIRDKKVNLNRILSQTNLRLSKLENIKFPIEEERDHQFIGREIVVIE
jgi:tRNA G10  N-methylase Trm11